MLLLLAEERMNKTQEPQPPFFLDIDFARSVTLEVFLDRLAVKGEYHTTGENLTIEGKTLTLAGL